MPLEVGKVHIEYSGQGDGERTVNMESHFIILKRYNDFGSGMINNFIGFADSYRDTVKSKLPIRTITICKPFTFYPSGDSRDKGPLDENSLLTIHYSKQTMHKPLADIKAIETWIDGKYFYVDLLPESRLLGNRNYYDSAGKSVNWMNRYKDQVPFDIEPSKDSIIYVK